MASRPLTDPETALARQVFHDRLPYRKIHITSYFLPGNEGVPVTMASVGSLVASRARRRYFIYFGPHVFGGGADARPTRNTFIHELTHVWQGHYRRFAWEFMVESMLSQGRSLLTTGGRGGAYEYTPGRPWRSYNVEQQAHIVQDWFAGGMSEHDVLFPYIENHIRKGRN
ncbi:MAG TPA: hypothetical protein VER32_11645 [Pyrinomonadaceae bacterium]|nr:hypothetical protein [Pyrinomonadaceae bacterium]